MDQHFLDVLKRHAARLPGPPDRISDDLDAACSRLASVLGACDSSVRQELLALVQPRILSLLGRNESLEASAEADSTNSDDAAGGQEKRNARLRKSRFRGRSR